MNDLLMISIFAALGSTVGSTLTIVIVDNIRKRLWMKHMTNKMERGEDGDCGCGKNKKERRVANRNTEHRATNGNFSEGRSTEAPTMTREQIQKLPMNPSPQ